MNFMGTHPVSWSKSGIIAYGDSQSEEGNLCITFLETTNGVNWRFHPPERYAIHSHLYETASRNPSINTNTGTASGGNPSNNSHAISDVRSSSNNNSRNAPSVTSTTTNNGSKLGSFSPKKIPYFFYNITSVHWNNWFGLSGDILAVCDELGNMTMLVAGQRPEGATTFDQLTVLFQDNIYKIHNCVIPLDKLKSNSETSNFERKRTKKRHLTAILDFHWLSSVKNMVISQFCALDTSTGTYRNRLQQIQPYGVFHPPFIKYACLSIRRNGQLDFWYQFSNSKDHKKITIQLLQAHNTSGPRDLDWLQFAKITSLRDEQSMLISTYSKCRNKFMFYKLIVNWNINTAKTNVLNNPTLNVELITEMTADETDEEGNVLKLVDMHVLSKAMFDRNTAPELLVIYHVCGKNVTLVKRFRIMHSVLPTDYLAILKPSIRSAKDGSVAPVKLKRYSLTQHTSIRLDGRVTHISSEILDNFVIFHFEDGSVMVFHQNDWSIETQRLSNQAGINTGKYSNIITSALSTGMSFPNLPPSSVVEWIKLSPTMTGMIYKLFGDPLPRFRPIFRQDISNPANDPLDSAAFAFAFVNSSHTQLSAEDLSIACKTHVTRLAQLSEERATTFILGLISTLYSLFNITPDGPKEMIDKLISTRSVQKITLLQMELGSGLKDRRITSIAKVILFLKNTLFAFSGVARNLHFAIEQMNNNSNNNNNNQQSTGKIFQTLFSKQDLVHSLIPITKWFVKFVSYLIREVLILTSNPFEKNNTLVLGVVGAKISRQLMLSVLGEIKKVAQIITKFPERRYPILNESSNFLKMTLGESAISFEKLEKFLMDVGNKLDALDGRGQQQQQQQQQHQKQEMSPLPSSISERNDLLKLECSLLVKAEFLPKYSHIEDFIISEAHNMLITRNNAPLIYFADTSGLRLTIEEFFVPEVLHLLQPVSKGLVLNNMENIPSHEFSRLEYDAITYDCFSEAELKEGKLKRCNRCGGVTRAGYTVSKDKTIVPTSIQTKRWPTMYTRTCICSGILCRISEPAEVAVTQS